jgi:hypothetical protein
MEAEEGSFRFDPRDLIVGPFIACPQCAEPTFGVLSIDGTDYVRRCKRRECWHTKTFPLWPLEKKIVYIDQLGISNMMKCLNRKVKGHARASKEALWLNLFETLDRVCKLQLVVCPDSQEHQTESLLSPFYEPLKRLYEQLSHGVSFRRASEIENSQVFELARLWISGEDRQCSTDATDVTSHGLHDWQSRYIISISGGFGDYVDQIRGSRREIHEALKSLFKFYQREKRTYDQWVAHENAALGKVYLEEYLRWQAHVREIRSGLRPFDPRWSMRPPAPGLVDALMREFRETGLSDEDAWKKVVYFMNEIAPRTPFHQIAGALYAVIAVKAGAGQRQPPNKGMATDIRMVASLMPYCDAMFIDNKCRALLENIPKKRKLPYKARIFSPSTGREFISYLQDLERNAPPFHMKLVEQVYGPDWGEPYTTMFTE